MNKRKKLLVISAKKAFVTKSLAIKLLASLENLVNHDTYETEYDGQMLTYCHDCGYLENKTHLATCAYIEAKNLVEAVYTTPIAQPVEINHTLSMMPMESEDGAKGWYIDGPDFYCDIERKPGEQYSVFIRSKDGAEGFAEIAQPAPTTEAWYPTESAIAALKRFHDGEGYDLPKDTMHQLAGIGLIYKNRCSMYCITDFGNSVLASAIVQPVHESIASDAIDSVENPVQPAEFTTGQEFVTFAQSEQITCLHDETERLGAIWTRCTQCNKKWADDEDIAQPVSDLQIKLAKSDNY